MEENLSLLCVREDKNEFIISQKNYKKVFIYIRFNFGTLSFD